MTDIDDEEFQRLWPDIARPPFAAGSGWDDRHLDAEVRWVQARKDFSGYIEGYRRAAEKVFESLNEDGYGANYLIWPIAFLWRHHMELSLKDIIATGRALREEGRKFPPHHGLLGLWRVARPYIEDCGSPDSPEFPHVEATLQAFERLDPGADAFRYPLAKDGVNASLRLSESDPDTMNVGKLQESVLAVANFFSGVRSEMSSRMDYAMEYRREMMLEARREYELEMKMQARWDRNEQ